MLNLILQTEVEDEQKAVELYQNAIKQVHLSVQVKNSRHYSNMVGLDIIIHYVTGLCQLGAKKRKSLACIMKMELGGN